MYKKKHGAVYFTKSDKIRDAISQTFTQKIITKTNIFTAIEKFPKLMLQSIKTN